MKIIYRAPDQITLVSDWGKYTLERFQKAIMKYNVGVTGELAKSFVFRVIATSGGSVLAAEIKFRYYGRFVDMGVGNGVRIEDVKNHSSQAQRAQMQLIHNTGDLRKPKKIYSRPLAGQVKKLAELMQEHYGIRFITTVENGFNDDLQIAV
jgi:hypothetical protein